MKTKNLINFIFQSEFGMVMKLKFQLLLLFCIIAITACAQIHTSTSFNIGDPAPPLRVQGWIKGVPVQCFEKGKVYAVEFWATWCRPCKAAMPHLSDLARAYKGKATVLAVDILEDKTAWEDKGVASLEQIRAVVDTMGHQMDFRVAVDDSNFMAHHWVESSGENSIPSAFVVNAHGRVAWIGNPVGLDKVLPKILDNSWDIRKARAKRIFNEHWEELDSETADSLTSLNYKWNKLGDLKEADSILLAIDRITKKNPKLKYAPNVAYFSFKNMLLTDPARAYEYGQKVIVTPTYDSPAYFSILSSIGNYSGKIKLHRYIYRLGAEAYQAEIDNTNPVYKKLLDTPGIYHEMAAWYRLAHDTSDALEAEQKSFNTVIIQRFETEKDTAFSTLALNDPYHLVRSTLLHPAITDSANGLTRIYKLYLEGPVTFMVGGANPSLWRIKPGDSLVFEESYYHHPPDSGIIFKTLYNTGLRLPNFGADTMLYNLYRGLFHSYYFTYNNPVDSFNSWVGRAYNLNEIKKIAGVAAAGYMGRNPSYTDSKNKKAYLESWYSQMIFRANETILVSKYSNIFDKDSVLLKKIDSSILKLAADIDRQDKIKTINYWITIKNIYDDILRKPIEAHHYNPGFIDREISLFSDTTRQFIVLNMIGDSTSSLIDSNLTWTALAAQIDLEIFKPYLKEYLSRRFIIGPEYLNVALRSARLYNTAMGEITLDSLFRETGRPYLLLSFCGSWSSSSMKEIREYSTDQRLNHSDGVRPVWLFFENDQGNWLKVIKKYNLPNQNCFLVQRSPEVAENFSFQFNWHSDFPHYFLFSREGKCISRNEVSFSKFNVKDILTDQSGWGKASSQNN